MLSSLTFAPPSTYARVVLSVRCATAEAATFASGAAPPPIATESKTSWLSARIARPWTVVGTGSPSGPASNVAMPVASPAAVTSPVAPTYASVVLAPQHAGHGGAAGDAAP